MEASVLNPATFIYKDLCTAGVKTSVTVLVYAALVPFGKREMISEGGWLGGGVLLTLVATTASHHKGILLCLLRQRKSKSEERWIWEASSRSCGSRSHTHVQPLVALRVD